MIMVGQDLIDPFDLVSKYRPFVLKSTETSINSKGVRRIALENLVARFLEWFMPSRIIWIVYFSLSALLIGSVYIYALTDVFFEGVEFATVVAAVTHFVGLAVLCLALAQLLTRIVGETPG